MRVKDGGRGVDVDAAAGIDAVLAEIDPSLGSDRRCHAESPSRWRKKRDPAVAGRRLSYACNRSRAACTVATWSCGDPMAAHGRGRHAENLDTRRRPSD